MKKLFLLATVAIAMIACNGNGNGEISGSTAPAKDQKALTTVTTEAVDMIGKDAASIDKSLKAAGFIQLEYAEFEAPAKKLKAFKAEGEIEAKEVYYAYNLPDNADKMSQEEVAKYFSDLLAKGQFYVAVVVVYVNDKVAAVETSLITGLSDNINLTYTDISDKLYKSLPSDAIRKIWQGALSVDGGDTQQYDKQEEYIAAIAKAKAVQAEEQGYAITSATAPEGLSYSCMWVRPTEEQAATMKQREGYEYTLGAFSVADLAVMQQIL